MASASLDELGRLDETEDIRTPADVECGCR